MAAGASSYAVVYRQVTEVASPPGDFIISLAEFAFGDATDYDADVVRGNAFVSSKATGSVRITGTTVSIDGIIEVRILIRRALALWANIS